MKLRHINNLTDLETIRNCWEGWQVHPNSDFSHNLLVCSLRKEVIHPYVTVVENEGSPCALIAARVERISLPIRIGYFKPIRIPVTILNVINQGVLGACDDEIAKAVVGHFWSLLRSGIVDIAVFNQLHEKSRLLKASLEIGPRWWCEKRPKWSTHWAMDLPDEPGFLLKKMKSKHRSWIRGKKRKLELAFSGRVLWRWESSFDDIPSLFERIEKVAAKTYQRGLGAGFVDNEEYRQRTILFAKRGQLRIQLLEIENNIRAFWIGQIYNGVFHSSATGYDPELRHFEPGTLIFLNMVDELIQEGIRKLDFGLGDASYKSRFGGSSWQETSLRMFSPNLKGLVLSSTIQSANLIEHVGTQLAKQVGAFSKLKTGWRRRKEFAKQKQKKND